MTLSPNLERVSKCGSGHPNHAWRSNPAHNGDHMTRHALCSIETTLTTLGRSHLEADTRHPSLMVDLIQTSERLDWSIGTSSVQILVVPCSSAFDYIQWEPCHALSLFLQVFGHISVISYQSLSVPMATYDWSLLRYFDRQSVPTTTGTVPRLRSQTISIAMAC